MIYSQQDRDILEVNEGTSREFGKEWKLRKT